MVVCQTSVRVDDRTAVEDRAAACPAINLLISDDDNDPVFCGRFLQGPQPVPREIDGIGKQAGVEVVGPAHPAARCKPPDECRITRQPGFWKHDQSAAIACSPGDQLDGTVQ